MGRFTFGLDIGIASVGWCVINNDKKRIEDLGVRIFPKAENPEDGSSLALPRRLARSARRRNFRKATRIKLVKELFIKYGLITIDQIGEIYLTSPSKKDPWTLRAEGLDRLLTGEELARVLTHIAKRRGFKSNRKNINDKKADEGLLLDAVKENRRLLMEKGYRTIGEMFYKDDLFKETKRNKAGDYKHTVDRKLLEEEVHYLFDIQRKLGSQFCSGDFENEYLKIFNWQKAALDGNDLERSAGHCTFETGEIRAPKHSFSAEEFVLLTKINNLKLVEGGKRIVLTEEQRRNIIKMAFSKEKITYKDLRKELKLPEETVFVGVNYNQDKNKSEQLTFVSMKGFHALKRVILKQLGQEVWDEVSGDENLLNTIAYALTFRKTDETITQYLQEKQVSESIIQAVLNVDFNFSRVLHLSLKALQKINVWMRSGLRYDEACLRAGYNHCHPHQYEKQIKLPPFPTEEIRNPVVIRALTQTRKVINALIDKYGSPTEVHIELEREMFKNFAERRKLLIEQEAFQKEKAQLKDELKQLYSYEPNGELLLKWRLWKQQNGFCPYSQKYMEPSRLDEVGYVQIDHIIPYSRCFDDSMNNKVLVMGLENQLKGNRLPFEYLKGDEDKWNSFVAWVRSSSLPYVKKERLLKEKYTEEDERQFKERNLNDTKYITKFIFNFLQDHLKFADSGIKRPVVAVNGKVTAMLRGKWGLVKHRDINHLHHAMDAAVVAVVGHGLVQKITEFYKRHEASWYPQVDFGILNEVSASLEHVKEKFPLPWEAFRNELLARLSDNPSRELEKLALDSYSDVNLKEIKPVFVSWAPNHKFSGKAHEETIRSPKYLKQGYSVVKTPLTKIKLNNLENMHDKEHNWKLYNLIRERLERYDNDPQKAFGNPEDPLRMPTNNGQLGPVVKSVRLKTTTKTGVFVNGNKGIADNGEMVRVDVFNKNSKYYLVPIYVADRARKDLPNKAITAGKSEELWNVIDDTYRFCFSLFPNDLVRIELKEKTVFGYYRACDRSTGAIQISNHCELIKPERVGVKTAVKLEKYQVDVLGNYYPIKREKRIGLEKCNC